MDNDIFIPYKFRASQIVGLVKIAVKAIEAEGLKLREAANNSQVVNKIGWFNELAGIYREYITGVANSVSKTHTLMMQAGGGPSKAEGELWSTVFNLVGSDIEPAANTVGAFLQVAFKTTKSYIGTTIIDESMQSSFLQLCRAKVGFGAQAEINYGQTVATWGGASSFSNALKFEHGLAKAPKVVIAVANSATIASPLVCDPRGLGPVFVENFFVWATAVVPGAGATAPVQWVAIS